MSAVLANNVFRWGDLVKNLVAKEIKVRYMGAALGFAWSLGNPIVVTLTYYVVFTFILPSSDDRFALHLVTGVVHWMFFQQVVTQSSEWLVNNHTLIKKLQFPLIVLPVSGALTVGAFWAVAMGVYWSLYLFIGGSLSAALLWYPVLLIAFVALTVGIGLVLSVLQVAHRDIKHIVDVLVPLLFWFTPIVWVMSSLPKEVQEFVSLNPLAPFFSGFTSILHGGVAPDLSQVFVCCAIGLGMLLIGLGVFSNAKSVVEHL